jgi:hypothetical protein
LANTSFLEVRYNTDFFGWGFKRVGLCAPQWKYSVMPFLKG